MGSAGKRLPAWPALYGAIYPVMLDAAKGSGYALAVHGSLARDLDVIAVPWTEDAIPAAELVDRVGEALAGHWWIKANEIQGNPTERPHGRLVWTIVLDGGAFVDLGVMPRRPLQGEEDNQEESDG